MPTFLQVQDSFKTYLVDKMSSNIMNSLLFSYRFSRLHHSPYDIQYKKNLSTILIHMHCLYRCVIGKVFSLGVFVRQNDHCADECREDVKVVQSDLLPVLMTYGVSLPHLKFVM